MTTADQHAVIVFEDVSKWFGPVVAVSELSFTITPGVTAVLGPNGAGKSTVMRMLCGLTAPSRGRVQVLGRAPRGDPDVYRHIGLVPQQESVLEPISARTFVRAVAELSGVPDADARAAAALADTELDPDDPRLLRTYSKGMRQRVKIAAALVHEPSIVVLDEPLNGLDPRQRLRCIDLFARLGDAGRTVVITSHILEEVERFGSRVIVIAEGRLAAEGDFHRIRALMDDRPHRIRVAATPLRPLAAALIDLPGVAGVTIDPVEDPRAGTAGAAASGTASGVGRAGSAVVDVHDLVAFQAAVLPAAQRVGARVERIEPLDEDLESVFRYLVARRW